MAQKHQAPSTVLTSDVVNYLIYRYLQESGFTHSAFTFGYESSITRTQIDPNNVPPGSLITFIQKGMQFLELEANLDEQSGDVPSEFTLLTPQELLENDVEDLRRALQERRESTQQAAPADNVKRGGKEKKRERQQAAAKAERSGGGGGGAHEAVPMDEDGAGPSGSGEFGPSSVTTLVGHESDVYNCSWSPVDPTLLASGSGDSTARIWDLSGGRDGVRCVVLEHVQDGEKSKHVTTLDWLHDGSLLATGSYDGVARIWGRDGKLRTTLCQHQGPVFSLKWNKKGDLLLSGSVDKTAVVWDAKTGEPRQTFAYHSAPTLDVDWRNNNTFATCSTDRTIHVCKLGDSQPLKTFTGHEDEVNAIKWDPSGRLLASCSDDATAKIWSLSQAGAVHDLTDHTKEIYTLKWSPTGPGSANPNLPLLLATASFDHTVKLWDAETGRAVHTLARHTESVYSVAFSPSGKLVATGSFDQRLHVWSVDSGELVRTYKGSSGIYEVCWNKDGDRLAAGFSNKVISVLDLRT